MAARFTNAVASIASLFRGGFKEGGFVSEGSMDVSASAAAQLVAGPAVPHSFVVLQVQGEIPFVDIARALSSAGLELRLDPHGTDLSLYVVRRFQRA